MPFVLNNVATADNYSDANTLECSGAVKFNIAVGNAAVFLQFSDPNSGGGSYGKGAQFGPEVYRPPALYSFVRNADRVRVRSAVAGAPAQVTIEALTFFDLS